MPEQLDPADLAVAFVEAFGARDMEAVARYIADDVVFESPRMTLTGAAAFLEEVGKFAQAVSGASVLAVAGDASQALIMYDIETVPFGTLRAVDRVVVRDGKITSDILVFDTSKLRQG
jgi:hypothetical protein